VTVEVKKWYYRPALSFSIGILPEFPPRLGRAGRALIIGQSPCRRR